MMNSKAGWDDQNAAVFKRLPMDDTLS